MMSRRLVLIVACAAVFSRQLPAAQSNRDRTDATAVFEAVSIKVTTERRTAPPDAPDRYYRAGSRLFELLADAFRYPRVRMIGLPDWGATTMFEFSA
jgi:hypothetical protein